MWICGRDTIQPVTGTVPIPKILFLASPLPSSLRRPLSRPGGGNSRAQLTILQGQTDMGSPSYLFMDPKQTQLQDGESPALWLALPQAHRPCPQQGALSTEGLLPTAAADVVSELRIVYCLGPAAHASSEAS